MFDGNFRSRREINYSGGTARRGRYGRSNGPAGSSNNRSGTANASSRKDILRHAETQRKQRQEQQRKDRACKLIQRHARGMIQRTRLLRQLSQLTQHLTLGTAESTNADATLQQQQHPHQHQHQHHHHPSLTTTVAMQLSLLSKPQKATAGLKSSRSVNGNTFNNRRIRELLLCYSAQLNPSSAPASTANSSIWYSQKRIAHFTLGELQSLLDGPSGSTDNLEGSLTSMFSILRSYFAQHVPSPATTTTTTSDTAASTTTTDVTLFIDLLFCTKVFWTHVITSLQTAAIASSSGTSTANTAPSSQQRQITAITRQLFQWCYDVRIRLEQQQQQYQNHAEYATILKASIAIVLLTSKSTSSLVVNKTSWMKPLVLQTLLPVCLQSNDYYQSWVEPLVPILAQSNSMSNRGTDPIDALPAQSNTQSTNTAQNYLIGFVADQMNGSEACMLRYALHLLQLRSSNTQQPALFDSAQSPPSIDNPDTAVAPKSRPHALLYLLHHVFQKDPQLAFLSSLVVRGEDVRRLVQTLDSRASSFKAEDSMAADDLLSDSDDDEDDNYGDFTQETVGQVKKTRRSSARYSRKELSTIHKLDRAYHNEILQLRHSIKTSSDRQRLQDITEMAHIIGQNSKQWLEWGLALLSDTPASSSLSSMTGVQNSTDRVYDTGKDAISDNNTAQDAYLDLLGLLLKTSTGIHTNSRMAVSSSFMTHIAFSRPLLQMLWKVVCQRLQDVEQIVASIQQTQWHKATDHAFAVFAVFCDLFTHHLIAMSDDDFLLYHTNLGKDVTAQSAATSSILAEDVITQLRNALHQLYWTKPVLVTDVALDGPNQVRFRLMLAGTKLWNSLYERWNRLVRTHAFCDESTWWFPYLSSRDGEGAVVSHPSMDGGDDDNDVGMNQAGSRIDGFTDTMDVDDDSASSAVVDGVDEMDVTADSESDVLAGSFRDPKMARILTSIPQAIPFDRRVKLFHSLLAADKIRMQDEAVEVREVMMAMMRGEDHGALDELRHQVSIHRSELYKDSMDQLNALGPKLKRKIKVSFFNQHNQQEAGIDGGGVFKEFLDDLIKEAFLGANSNESSSDEDSDDAEGNRKKNKKKRTLSAIAAAATAAITGSRRQQQREQQRLERLRQQEEAEAAAKPVSRAPKLFSVTPLQTLAVRTSTTGNLTLLQHYEFLGRVLGKAVYESILVEPQFCLPFLNQLLGKTNTLEDLKNYDPEYYRNLTSLRNLSASDIESAALTFELTVGGDDDEVDADDVEMAGDNIADPMVSSVSKMQTIELVPGGRDKAVTKQNVIQYIHLVAHYRLNIQTYHQTRAFLRGFRDLIPASWVRLFSANELQKVIGGDDSIRGIDVASLKRAMQYAAGYHPSQSFVQDFWDLLQNEFTPDQQRKFLKFMTSCSRQPLLGFASLEPAPCIQQIRLPENGDMENSRLPTSSTCMNLLKLPNYRSKDILRKKLLAAIESGAGFELT